MLDAVEAGLAAEVVSVRTRRRAIWRECLDTPIVVVYRLLPRVPTVEQIAEIRPQLRGHEVNRSAHLGPLILVDRGVLEDVEAERTMTVSSRVR